MVVIGYHRWKANTSTTVCHIGRRLMSHQQLLKFMRPKSNKVARLSSSDDSPGLGAAESRQAYLLAIHGGVLVKRRALRYTCFAASGESGKASDLAVARATGRDNVLSLFSVRRRLAAMAVSASGLLRASEASLAAAARLAKGLCSTGDGDRGRSCEWASRELSSIPWLTAVAMVVLAVEAMTEEAEAMPSVYLQSTWPGHDKAHEQLVGDLHQLSPLTQRRTGNQATKLDSPGSNQHSQRALPTGGKQAQNAVDEGREDEQILTG
ncbi:MAG: hypothetical protein FRX49_06120 [Trebouxia sp. A1-2]|nr:MAG: hypothetical protein FRX49_06120 [Trebouxia sp. A1-2]